jgi:hypothetical protein
VIPSQQSRRRSADAGEVAKRVNRAAIPALPARFTRDQ